MEEDNSNAMNPNLDPDSGSEQTIGSITNEIVQGINGVLMLRAQHLPIPQPEEVHDHLPADTFQHPNMFIDLNDLVNSGNGSAYEVGEGSVVAKTTPIEKGSDPDGDFFECSICLDLSKDPVVTPCGHLFCWPCIFPWLSVSSNFNECPNCKGEVFFEEVTPVFGRGGNLADHASDQEGADPEIVQRPEGRRVENLRHYVGITNNGFMQGLHQELELENADHEQDMRNEQNFMAPQENPAPADVDVDIDSFFNFDDFINSLSEVDAILGMNSVESLSASSSRRGNDASGVLNVDTDDQDFQAPSAGV